MKWIVELLGCFTPVGFHLTLQGTHIIVIPMHMLLPIAFQDVPPRYNALRTTLLQKEIAHVERLLKPIKDYWLENGVSIVSDGWSDP